MPLDKNKIAALLLDVINMRRVAMVDPPSSEEAAELREIAERLHDGRLRLVAAEEAPEDAPTTRRFYAAVRATKGVRPWVDLSTLASTPDAAEGLAHGRGGDDLLRISFCEIRELGPGVRS